MNFRVITKTLMSHFLIACRPIPLHFSRIVVLLRYDATDPWTSQRWPRRSVSNELCSELGMGGMNALLAHVFLSWAGSVWGCGARLTCTFTKVHLCVYVDWSWNKEVLFFVKTLR